MGNSGWQLLVGAPEEWAGSVEDLGDALDPVVSILEAAQQILQVASSFVQRVDGLTDSIFSQSADLIKEFIKDIVDSSVALCAHCNLKWNDNWSWSPKPTLETVETGIGSVARNPNYTEDGDLPWTGNGMSGFLTDILGSALNGSNRGAPRTDADSPVYCMILVLGFPDISAFMNLPPQVRKFLASIGIEPSMAFLKDRWDILKSEQGKSFLRAKDTLFLDDEYVPVDPTLKESTLEPIQKLLDSDITSSESFSSAVPVWIKASLADLLGDATGNIFVFLENFAESLATVTDASPLVNLVSALSLKIGQLNKAIKRIDELMETLVNVIAAITEFGKYIVVEVDEGGFQSVINEAISAEGIPDYGPKGICVGLCAVSSIDSGADQLEKLLKLFGNIPSQFDNIQQTTQDNLDSLTASIQTSAGQFQHTWE